MASFDIKHWMMCLDIGIPISLIIEAKEPKYSFEVRHIVKEPQIRWHCSVVNGIFRKSTSNKSRPDQIKGQYVTRHYMGKEAVARVFDVEIIHAVSEATEWQSTFWHPERESC
jgi:hypothetical protein